VGYGCASCAQAAIAKGNGQHALEAPVTGGLVLLQEAKMTVFIGGEEHVFEKYRHIFETSFNSILYMGDMGVSVTSRSSPSMPPWLTFKLVHNANRDVTEIEHPFSFPPTQSLPPAGKLLQSRVSGCRGWRIGSDKF
jgi:hypothetical protein